MAKTWYNKLMVTKLTLFIVTLTKAPFYTIAAARVASKSKGLFITF